MQIWVIAVMICLGLGLYLGVKLLRWRRSSKLAQLRLRGQQGEINAERWLSANGFEILDSQATQSFTYFADGQARSFRVRPDIMARFAGQHWLIEVKTGKSASPDHAATRRQLREYAQLWPRHRCALFDASQGLFYEVSFQRERLNLGAVWQQCSTPVALMLLIIGVGIGLLIGVVLS